MACALTVTYHHLCFHYYLLLLQLRREENIHSYVISFTRNPCGCIVRCSQAKFAPALGSTYYASCLASLVTSFIRVVSSPFQCSTKVVIVDRMYRIVRQSVIHSLPQTPIHSPSHSSSNRTSKSDCGLVRKRVSQPASQPSGGHQGYRDRQSLPPRVSMGCLICL